MQRVLAKEKFGDKECCATDRQQACMLLPDVNNQ